MSTFRNASIIIFCLSFYAFLVPCIYVLFELGKDTLTLQNVLTPSFSGICNHLIKNFAQNMPQISRREFKGLNLRVVCDTSHVTIRFIPDISHRVTVYVRELFNDGDAQLTLEALLCFIGRLNHSYCEWCV